MNWQPIETAPADVPVVTGTWEQHPNGEPRWVEEITIAYRRRCWGLWRERTGWTEMAVAWRPVPAPPDRR